MTTSTDNPRVTQRAGVVGSATFLSRILGYLRDMVIASFFGAGLASDVFIAAFRIPNFLRRLFGEGSLSIAFIPVFTDTLKLQGRAEAERLAISSIRLLSVVLLGICLLGVALAPWLVHMLAYGFVDQPEKFTLCVKLTRIMFPYLLFIGLVALCMGILNVLGHFAAPALAPALLNIAMIGMLLLFAWISPSQATRVAGLSLGVLLGGMLQLGLQVPLLIKKGIAFWRSSPWWHPAMKKILLLMWPVLFGTAVYQINSLIICLLASMLPQGSISYLYYADRLVQFPLGIFAISLATALLPTLALQAANQQWEQLQATFAYALRLVFFVTLPAMAGLIVLREPVVRLLFARGAFDEQAVRLTASALIYYGVGLWAFAAVRIVLSTFYALKDAKTPVVLGAVAIIFNTVMGVLLMGPMQHNGLALALSLASALNLAMLTLALRRRMGALGWRPIASAIGRSGLCALLMGWAVWALARWIFDALGTTRAGTLAGVGVCIVAGVVIYGALAYAVKMPELRAVMRMITGKMRPT